MRPRSQSLAVLALAAAAAAGCGSTQGATAHARAAAAPSPHQCVSGAFHKLGSSRLAYAGIVFSHAEVRRHPGRGPLFARFGRLNQNGVPVVLSVRGARVDAHCRKTWYLVQAPVRPNGVTGWVSAAELNVATVKTRIVVDVSARRLTLYRAGKPVLRTAVAVGAPATPTPTGSFYVNQRLIPADPNGPFGPGAVGVSAFSNVLTGWTQGGPIAIHGTNEPWSIGRPVSNGCIRVPNPTLRRIFKLALSGTPVVIRP